MNPEKSPWYVQAFGSLYSLVYSHRSDEAAATEVAFVLRHVQLAPGARILDLACGNGRHVRALSCAGYSAVGMDLSRDLLQEAGQSGTFVRADMRTIPFADESFGAVMSFFTSFGYFKDSDEDLAVLNEARRVLIPEGWFLLDFLRAESVTSNLVPRSERVVKDLRITEERRIEDNNVMKRVRVVREDGEKLLDYEESVRLYEQEEIGNMIAGAGMEIVDWFGDFEGAQTDAGSRLIALAKRGP